MSACGQGIMSSDIIPAHRAVSAAPQKAAAHPSEVSYPLADKKNIESNMKKGV